ncbi:MAG: pyridoxal 5'-phosphate synthase glutaminase subunit PdxT [Desulfobacterales bacterium]|jgi:5'-phosphate synthase pdxT subunit
MKIGILALQGDFFEHISMLHQLGMETVEVRLPQDLAGIAGLIIPGGESTTIGKLAVMYGLMDPLQKLAAEIPIWGTCAGMIFMAKQIDSEQPLLGIMDIVVQRNAFGRQLDSFSTHLDIPLLHKWEPNPFPAIFIRAPKLVAVRSDAEVLAELNDGTAVAAQQGKRLVTAFHPELSKDDRFHRYFLSLTQN